MKKIIEEIRVVKKHWGPDDDYLVIPELQVIEQDGFKERTKVRVTIEIIEE